MDDLRLKVNDFYVTGWTAAQFTAGLERMPRTFQVELTEPIDRQGRAQGLFVQGMPIQVYIADDKVMTGYVDVVACSISGNDHTVHIAGRSMCEDLVDCSAEIFDSNGYPQVAFQNRSTIEIAADLAKPYSIKVQAPEEAGNKIPYISINLGESGYHIIERCARSTGLLVYDNEYGDLVLGAPATEPPASGTLAQGVNILAAHTEFNLCERYGKYEFYSQSVLGHADKLEGLHYNPDKDPTHGVAYDSVFNTYTTPTGKPRNRKLIQIADQPMYVPHWQQLRADWECNRRMGRSQRISISLTTWRDDKGTLFRPNSMIHFTAPACRLTDKEWLICDVTFSKSLRGTICDLVLMPKEAFAIEPYVIAPMQADKVDAINRAQDAAPSDKPGDIATQPL